MKIEKKKNLYPVSSTTPIMLGSGKVTFTGAKKVWDVVVRDRCDMEILENLQFHTFMRFKDDTKVKGESILDVDIYMDHVEHNKILELLEKNLNTTIEGVKDPSIGKVDVRLAYAQSRFLINKWAYKSSQYPMNAICKFAILKNGKMGFYLKYYGEDKWHNEAEVIEVEWSSNEYGKLMTVLKAARNTGEVPGNAKDMRSSDFALKRGKQSTIDEMFK